MRVNCDESEKYLLQCYQVLSRKLQTLTNTENGRTNVICMWDSSQLANQVHLCQITEGLLYICIYILMLHIIFITLK